MSGEVLVVIWGGAGRCSVLRQMKGFILFLVQWDGEQSRTPKEPERHLLPSLPEVVWSVFDCPQPLHNAMGLKRLLWMFPMVAISCRGFHGPLCLLYPLPYLDFYRTQTHTLVLLPPPYAGPESLLCSVLPAGHCETGATQQRPGACRVKWRGVFIWGKTRLGLLTKLVKSETCHFVRQALLKHKVYWALRNKNVVQWLIWYVATDTFSCWPLQREGQQKSEQPSAQLKGLFWADFESFSADSVLLWPVQLSKVTILYTLDSHPLKMLKHSEKWSLILKLSDKLFSMSPDGSCAGSLGGHLN